MSELVFVFLSEAAEVIKNNIFLFGIMRFPVESRKRLIFSSILLLGAYFALDGYFYEKAVPFYIAMGIQFILSCIWVWINCGEKWWKSILLYMGTQTIINFIDIALQLCSTFLFGFDVLLVDTSVSYVAGVDWAGVLFDVILMLIFYKYDFISKWEIKWYDYVVFAIIILIFELGLGAVQIYLITSTVYKVFLLCVCIVIGIIIFALSIIMFSVSHSRQHYQEKNQLNEHYQELQEKRYEDLYQKIKELRGFRHDYRHHVNYMNQLCAASEWEGLQKYVQSLGKMQHRVSMVSTGNFVVDAVVSYFQMQMQEKGIELHWFGTLPKQLAMEVTETCALFSNLLENAVEASEQVVQATGERVLIQVDVQRDEQYIYVDIVNRMLIGDTEVLKTKKKGSEHGFGIWNIKAIVDRYHGMIEWKVEGDTMHVEMELMVMGE